MATPSREFLIAQAALHVMPADRWKLWHDFVSSFGVKPVTYMAVNLRYSIIREFNALAKRYGE